MHLEGTRVTDAFRYLVARQSRFQYQDSLYDRSDGHGCVDSSLRWANQTWTVIDSFVLAQNDHYRLINTIWHTDC